MASSKKYLADGLKFAEVQRKVPSGTKNDRLYYLDRKCFIGDMPGQAPPMMSSSLLLLNSFIGDMHGQAHVLWCAMAMIE